MATQEQRSGNSVVMPAATLLAPASVAAAEQDLANIIAGFLAITSDDVAVLGTVNAAGTNTYLVRFSGTSCAAHACAPCKLGDSFQLQPQRLCSM